MGHFLGDQEAAFGAAGLTDVERDMIRRRDFRALIQYGAIFFVLEKLPAVLKPTRAAIRLSSRLTTPTRRLRRPRRTPRP